ncbi:SusC/RagA family TonB-linked outer membrane protein [Sphingobacterium sp. LRF_L2]|uniref:SusC/RagA family TonB-linked outer membrane protein n=1 Tax=Sphingobacterium sp. LRF_L2 TaxID=3369421 RepID=UPI003F617121
MNESKSRLAKPTINLAFALGLSMVLSVPGAWSKPLLYHTDMLTNQTVQSTVKGKIISEDGEALAGVTITNLRSQQATATDFNGSFNIEAQQGDSIEVKVMGYQIAVQMVTGNSLNITLKKEESAIEEVVVTAIGIKQQKRKIGYATQEVKTDVLQQSKTMNIGNALTGQVAGLNVNNPTGIFQAPTFNLRGKTPLIVVDGIPVETDFFDIPSQNIENINVLKGTSASALYGSRGRDGAILITTRNAKSEKLELTVGTTNMFSAGFTVFPESQMEYGSGSNGQYEFWDGADGGISDGDMAWGPKLNTGDKVPQWNSPIRDKETGEVIPWWGDVSGTIYDDKSRYERVPTDWVAHDNLRDFLQTGLITENNVTLSYKTDKLSLFTSGKYAFQKGQVPNTKVTTGGANINASYRFLPTVQFDLNLSYNKVQSPNYPRYGYGPKNHMYTILLWMGNDVDGKDLANHLYVPGQEGYRQANYNYAWYNNPYFAAYELTQLYDQDVLHGQSKLSWQISPKFTVQGRVSARQKSKFEDMKVPKSYMNYGDSRNGDYKTWDNKQINFDADVLATYTEKFSDNFGLTLNAGGSTFKRDIQNAYMSTDGLVVPYIYNMNNSQGPLIYYVEGDTKSQNYLTEKVVRSAYGSLNFDVFKSTYINFSARNDWSSTLPVQNASYFYPSVSVSSILSDYFKLGNGVDYWKIYGSWASVSNDLDPYSISSVYKKSLTYSSTPSVTYPSELINNNILPEQSISYEIGTSLGLLKNKLTLDLTYYNVLDKNQIIDLDVSQSSGFSSRKVNGPKTRTQGFEVMLNANLIQHRNFSWNTAANWSRSVERILAIYDGVNTWSDRKVGDRADAYYATVWQKSADGQLILNENTGMPTQDQYLSNIGYFNPDWQFGFLNTFKYKDFTINLDIDGSVGGIMRSQTIEKMWWGGKHPSSTLYRDQEYETGQNAYKPTGVVVTGGELVRDTNGNVTSDTRTYSPYTGTVNWQSWSQNYPYRARVTEEESELFANVYDRSFVKLRRLAVSYDLNKIIRSKKLNALDASVFGYNLMVLKNIPYVDPDFGIGNDDNLQDPSTRYIGVSLNFKF